MMISFGYLRKLYICAFQVFGNLKAFIPKKYGERSATGKNCTVDV